MSLDLWVSQRRQNWAKSEKGKAFMREYNKKYQQRPYVKAQIKISNAKYRHTHLKQLCKKQNEYNRKVKLEVFSYYGASLIKCRWPGCEIIDIDMLTLDHVDSNGASERKGLRKSTSLGPNFYRYLKKKGYPAGYQILCFNHNWKKEVLRKRHQESPC